MCLLVVRQRNCLFLESREPSFFFKIYCFNQSVLNPKAVVDVIVFADFFCFFS